MRKSLVLIFLALAGCAIDFERHYNQIDSDMIRPISYWFRNNYYGSSPETAPGDIAVLDIFFVGKRITLDDITDFRVSWNVFTDGYGNLAPRGEEPLKLLREPLLVDGMNGQILRLAFQIPPDILHNADVIPNDLSELSRNYRIGDISEIFGISKKADVLAQLENLAKNPELQKSIPYEMGAMINGLAQIFSAQYQIYLDFKGDTPRTKMRNTARWHGRLRGVDGIYVNNNPEILREFDTLKISVSRTNVLDVEVSEKDTAMTLEQAFTTQITNIETYRSRWFFEGSAIRNKLDISQEMNVFRWTINAAGNAKVGDTGWVWLWVYDERLGVANHPQGRDIVGFPIKFVE